VLLAWVTSRGPYTVGPSGAGHPCPLPEAVSDVDAPTKQISALAKPFGRTTKATGNIGLLTSPSVHHEGSIMWDVIINLIYDRSCRNYLAAAEAARMVDLTIGHSETTPDLTDSR
jgi:hypothetical protein